MGIRQHPDSIMQARLPLEINLTNKRMHRIISYLTKRSFVKALFASIPQTIFVSVGVSEIFRGKQLEALGFKEYDALHIACAETAKADVFLTTDDAVIRRAKRLRSQLRVRVENPDTWLQAPTSDNGGN